MIDLMTSFIPLLTTPAPLGSLLLVLGFRVPAPIFPLSSQGKSPFISVHRPLNMVIPMHQIPSSYALLQTHGEKILPSDVFPKTIGFIFLI